jgi:hypothetical protein
MQAVRKASHILSRSSIELTRPRTPTIVEQYGDEITQARRSSRRILPEFQVSNASSLTPSSVKNLKKESGDLIAILQRQEREALNLKGTDGTGVKTVNSLAHLLEFVPSYPQIFTKISRH